MTQPLAIVYFQQPMPGNQLVNRLQDADYRVQTAGSPGALAALAQTTGAMLVLADVESATTELTATLEGLRRNPATCHLPLVAFASTPAKLDAARLAGITLVVESAALLAHLPGVLEQALRVD